MEFLLALTFPIWSAPLLVLLGKAGARVLKIFWR